ncbi:excinuclease ABC subunit UvrA [Desulfobacterales bacterium HSG16]|nr:excinuclease ABC subunit UvrA [Desulfobacterales bacterium HSG16]
MKSDHIVIKGARQHNLKNIDVTLPRNRLVVITGLSGSGKSTLAFDTLYAEGQRRYVESLSAYARQFLERMDKPDVDTIEGLSPAIAIEQKTASHNPRSTVGTVTEIYDYLRLLFARIGVSHCYKCGKPISSQSLDQILDQIMSLPEKSRLMVIAPLVSAQKGTYEKLFSRLKKEGFARVRVDGKILELESLEKLSKNRKHSIEVVIDRLVMKKGIENRLADSVELALGQSLGHVIIMASDPGKKKFNEPVLYSENAACTDCGISYPEFTPASFSFNSPQGACPKCDGLGASSEFDPELIIPDPTLSLKDGAISVWSNKGAGYYYGFLAGLAEHYKVDTDTPYKDLTNRFKKVLLYGSGKKAIDFIFERDNRHTTFKKPWEGVIPNLSRRYVETESSYIREEISRFMTFRPCSECNGKKLNKSSMAVKIGGMAIPEVTALSVEDSYLFFDNLKKELTGKDALIGSRILKEVCERLGFLKNVGLSYLTLDRSAHTLSGGESQRIRLATQIGSRLTGVLYVLDEPSIGLHQRDNRRLLATLERMRDLGNTVLVVEHDEETIRAADHVVDMGPGAGINGGHVVFSGHPDGLASADQSLTGQYFSGKLCIETPKRRRKADARKILLKGACANNLNSINTQFPLGLFTCVTGVSGSGKSTLVFDTLYRALAQSLYKSRTQPGKYNKISGIDHIDKVINIDQSPIGRTPRSNPGTYTGVFNHIRELFAKTPDARMHGYKAGRFSFNVKGGRCESCRGDGIIKIEMHFLPDVYVACDVCGGRRYNRETLEIRYKEKNIADVLDMTINQSLAFFQRIGSISTKLQTLVDVGLGYIKIGQRATTLSGGEAQRVKLSRELGKRATGKTVYILDEPTTGLHLDDIRRLLDVLNRLVDMGNTVIVIEHNLDVIKCADHVIDLGPEGGDKGGNVVAQGTPEDVARTEGSYTGEYLKKLLL